MFITRKFLSRRTVLRGAGASIALPLLDAMIPAATALAAALIAEGGAAEVLVTGAGHWRGEGAARLVAPAQGGAT